MRPGTSYTGYLKEPISFYDGGLLSTGRPIDEELFALLQYFSEASGPGKSFIKSINKSKTGSETKRIYLVFQSYIRQAKTFYESAQLLHYRASSLLYYYSFLNLIKAYLISHAPNSFRDPIKHGMKYTMRSSKFNSQTIRIIDGVFPLFYEKLTGNTIPLETSLNIINLLGYCTDISNEYTNLANYGIAKNKSAKWMICMDKANAWPLLAVEGFGHLEKYKKFMQPFHVYFEEVDINKSQAGELFNMSAREKSFFRFFESKNPYPLVNNDISTGLIKRDCSNALKNYLASRPFNDGYDFNLAMPLRTNLQIPFSEVLGIYSAMFFLGSLVRYYPRYLEKLFDSKELWILERFIKSTPLTFLRLITNLITNKSYILAFR